MKMSRFAVLCAGASACMVIGAPADAGMIVFNFDINVAQEVPAPNIPAGFNPSGTGMVTLDTDANTIEWIIDYQGLTGPIVAPGAHFHGPADFGETAGVQIFISDGDPSEPATGTLVGSALLTNGQEADLLAGLWYVNIHTELNPSGEIRGQVIPTPATFALLGAAGLVTARRRRSG